LYSQEKVFVYRHAGEKGGLKQKAHGLVVVDQLSKDQQVYAAYEEIR
jgi:hypothetical protein